MATNSINRCSFLTRAQAIFLILYAGTFVLLIPNSFGQEAAGNAALLNRFNQWRDEETRQISPKLPLGKAMAAVRTTNSVDTFSGPAAISLSGWKSNITTTVFWIGEKATVNNPVSNDKSAWDIDWVSRYGGYDNPNPGARTNFVPRRFQPGLNPFYIALPYNDVQNHHTRPEAATVIPWFKNSFVRDGQSVCKGRWIAVRHGNRVCYAQWEDVGPFASEHWKYVFGNERPSPNPNRDAGLDVSPAVRDYLGLQGLDTCDWKFVDSHQIPPGPWTKYGF